MIRKILLLSMLLSGLLFAVEWVEGFDAAMKQAAKEHKTVMVMVVSPECRWCKKMKHRTLEDTRVEQKLKQFVVVQVMRNDAKSITYLPKVDGVPTIFFLSPEGKVMQELLGYMGIEDFLAYVADIEKMMADRK